MHRSLLVVASLLCACTFNVRSVSTSIESSAELGDATSLRADVSRVGGPFQEASVTIRGSEGRAASATVDVSALLAGGDSEAGVREGVRVEWADALDGAVELRVGYAGTRAETVSIESMSLALPVGTALELTGDAVAIDVAGLAADATVSSDSGAIRIADGRVVALQASSGAIDVEATRGELHTDSGAIDMAIAEHVTASASSGAIRGTLGTGGTISTDSGAIEIAITGALDRDLVLTADSGAIHLVVPVGLAAAVDVESQTGVVRVSAGGDTVEGHGWSGALNGGGPHRVRCTTDSGAITIEERVGS